MATSNMFASERVSAAAAVSQARRHMGVSFMVATSVFVLVRDTGCAVLIKYCFYIAF